MTGLDRPLAAGRRIAYNPRIMALSNGTKLGPYEIEGPLGAGGMGEVYKARDTRLERTVAIKVLPEHLANNEETRARFAREAKAVSSLNHPNICTLYDIGKEDGIFFLVMEHIEGDTLATRLEQGTLPAPEVLKTAIEIADALDKAHRQGFVHRDLKPGNIMLTKAGAKLLDFGLARPTEAQANEHDLTQSPTVSRPLTAEGAIVGTFQYMAPEQLEGAEADARTDLFAFGAVLYEMMTGNKAFGGKTQASLIASILKEEPRSIAELQPMTPPALERVVKRCLSKDPDDRWQTARDLMLELTWIRDAGSSVIGTAAPVRMRRKSRERLAWTAAVFFALIAIALAVPRLTQKHEPRRVSRFDIEAPDNVSIVASQPMTCISPDGRHVIFLAADTLGTEGIWVRSLDTRAARMLPGSDTGFLPFWSADSREVAFFRRTDGKLVRVGIDGGAPQIVCEAPDGRGGSWSREGVIVFAARSGGPLYQVPAAGGEIKQVTELDEATGEEGHRFPQFLPDGRHFFFVSLPIRDGYFNTFVGSLDSFARKHVMKAGGATVYANPGSILFERDQLLVAQPYDTKKLEPTGVAVPIGEPPGLNNGWTGAPSVSASANGVLARAETDPTNTELIWFDYEGRRQGVVPTSEGFFGGPAVSANGRYVAVSQWIRASAGFDADVWTIELGRGMATRFTFDKSENYQTLWAPDSRRVAFVSDRTGNENIFVKSLDGGNEEPLLEQGALFTKCESWSPDGRYLVFHTLTKETGLDVLLLPMDGDRQPVPFVVTEFNEADASVSPDGKWIAYRSDESGTWELYVQSFPTPGNKYRVSPTGAGAYGTGSLRGWGPGGRELIYIAGDLVTVMSASVTTEPRFATGTPRALFRLPRTRFGAALDPTRERILVSLPAAGRPPSVHIVTDWDAALDR